MISQRFLAIVIFIMLLSSPAGALELVLNGDFEAAPGAGIPNWVTGGNPTVFNPSIHTNIIQHDATTGQVAVAPGNSGESYNDSWLTQQIYIPRDALGTTLTFYYDWYKHIPFGTQTYFLATFGSVELAREQDLSTGFHATPTPGWTQVEKYLNLEAYSNKTITLSFHAYSPDAYPNYVLIDGITLDVVTATKTTTPTLTCTPTITPTLTISPTSTYTPTITKTCTITPSITQTLTVTPWPVPVGDAVAFPNPATGNQVTFMYSLEAPADINIEIYNTLGYKVAHLEDSNKSGQVNRRTTWNINAVAPGIYLYQVVVKGHDGQLKRNKMRRLVITK